jgi:uncharacterized protein (PEP-CTERM system associated)
MALTCGLAAVIAADVPHAQAPQAQAPSAPAQAPAASRITPFVSADLTFTNNVELQPADRRESDVVLTVRPGISFERRSPRGFVQGSFAVPVIIHGKTRENDEVFPQADIAASYAIVEDRFFVDASAHVLQTYIDPFGARPSDLVNETGNRYTASTYRVRPYLQGLVGSSIRYLLSDENIWTRFGDSPVNDNVYTNDLAGRLDYEPRPFGWGLDINRTEQTFRGEDRSELLQLARVRGVYRPDPQFEAYLSGGYERNRFELTEFDGAIYGVGARWRPTPRTTFDAGWEHRFFGSSYTVLFDHRTARTAWNVTASRNISSYPQELARLPAGVFVPTLLNEILASTIQDPSQRIQAILDYMRARGLPVVSTEPLSLFSRTFYIQENARATAGLIGVRNSLFFGVHRGKTEPVPGTSDLFLPSVGVVNDLLQTGATITWSNRLSSLSSLNVTAIRTESETKQPLERKSTEWSVRATLTRTLSPNTTAHAGARYQAQDADRGDGYTEFAVFVGVSHFFR